MYNKYKQRFAIKKFTIGVASVFIGGTALMATDVLPFSMVNVASASEVTTSGITSKGIEYKLVNNNTKDYSLNGQFENLILSIKGVNEQAEADSLSIVIEKTGPVDVSMKSPDEAIKSETIGNTTKMKLGSFTEGSYYSIPIFTKYKYDTDNGTTNDLTVKVINDVTGEVLYSDTIHQVNKASEITEITLDETIEMRGKFNIPENKVVESPLRSYYTNAEYIYHEKEFRLSDTSIPKGGDYLKKTIVSGENNFEIVKGIITLKDSVNKKAKITEPLVVKYEVVNSRGEKKGIEKTVTYSFEYEDVYDYTTWEEIDKPEKIYFSPALDGYDKKTQSGEITLNESYVKSTYKYHNKISTSLKEALYVETETTDTPNVNYIRYANKEYSPKEFKMTILENNLSTPLDFSIDIAGGDIKDKIENFEKGKIWIKRGTNEKEYIYGEDTIYDIINNYKKYSNILKADLTTMNNSLFDSDTFEDYFNKYKGTSLKEGLYSDFRGIIINIKGFENVTEIGIDFPEDFKIKSKMNTRYLRNVRDSELENIAESQAENLISININLDNEYEKDITTLLKVKSSTIYNDNQEMSIGDVTVKNVEVNKWTPTFLNFSEEVTATPEIDSSAGSGPNGTEKQINKKLTDKKIKLLSKNVQGITTGINTSYDDFYWGYLTASEENIQGNNYSVISTGYITKDVTTNEEYYNITNNMKMFTYKNNPDMYKLNKNERGEIEFPDIEFLLQIPKEIMKYVEIPIEWIKIEELSTGEYNTYRNYKNLKFKTIPAEGFLLKDTIKNESLTNKVNKNDILDMKTEIYNNQTSSVSNLSVVKVVPKIGNLALNGDKVTDSLDTDFIELSGDTDGWDIYYSTTVRQQGESVSTITDWTQEMPSDKSTITHVKWVKRDNLSGGNGATLGFKVKAKELNNKLDNKVTEEINYSRVESWKLNTISGFNLGNNDTYGGSISASLEIFTPRVEEYSRYFIDTNNNKIKDETEVSSNLGSYDPTNNDLYDKFKDSIIATNNYSKKDKETQTFLDNIFRYNVIEVGESLEQPEDVGENLGFNPKPVYKNYYLKVEEAHPLVYKYYDVNNGEIIKTNVIKSFEVKKAIVPADFLIKEFKDSNNNEWKVDLDTSHTHPKTKEKYIGRETFDIGRDGDLELQDYRLLYYGQPLEIYIPMKKEKSGKIDIVLVDKATGNPLKVTNIVTEDSKPEGERVTIEESDAPDYITIGETTYKKVEKPDLPTEAVVPGATDNADVEFEYEVVRGAVYGVFKTEEGNNIIKDKVTIIEGGQPEDTRREYTAPRRITDDNGKVWELVSPAGSVSYTNGENAIEHILTYREVKKNVTVKYVTNTGETIKEEVAFENKSVGSKYRINTPETITKDNEIYNVSGEREIAGAVEDNDNIITIEVSPKPKQVAIIKFVDNNGEEISGIERKRVEGYDGTNINVTLENIPNYRITNNPFETAQVFDTDYNVDQEFSVVLEKLPTTAIPFETEYVADETREYGSENITEREGVEGAREDNGEITRQPVNKIVKVATGSKVERKETPFNVIYEADESKAFGDNSTTNGKNKVEEITTTYTLNETTGVVTPNTPTIVLIEAGNPETHTFGTKSTVTTEDIPFTTEYVGDNTVDYGTENVNTEGVTGVRTTTTTYRLDKDSHTVVANNPIVDITKQPVNKVVSKGTKPTETVISETAFTTITKEDSTLNKGEEIIEVEGVNGKTVNITEYTVNRETGEVTSTTREEVREAVNKVVRVGTKETSINETTEDTPNTNNKDNNTTGDNSNGNETTEETTTPGNENTNIVENNSGTGIVENKETTEENNSTTNTSEVETDTLTAEEEKAKEYKHSDAWEESANEYNKQKETVTDESAKENVENKEKSLTPEDPTEVKTDTPTVAEVKAKELPETNTNNSLLYTATALIGLATLLRRKQSQ